MDESLKKSLEDTIDAIPELSVTHMVTYARLWQFETWLRQMVYVELYSKFGQEWRSHLEGKSDSAKENDQSLTHMPEPEEMELSFISFSALTKTIKNNWSLFSSYLPKQLIWDARIDEVSQIRNRIAHFRRGHIDDSKRVIQLLRDVDNGFFRFCASLNRGNHQLSTDINDPIIREFIELNPYVRKDSNKVSNSLYNHYTNSFEIRIDIVSRPWSSTVKDFTQVIGFSGYLYELSIHIHNDRAINYRNLLIATKPYHDLLLYIFLGHDYDHMRVFISSLLGQELLIKLFETFIDTTANNLYPYRSRKLSPIENTEETADRIQGLADEFPEYVIGPQNPFSYLDDSIPCSFFAV